MVRTLRQFEISPEWVLANEPLWTIYVDYENRNSNVYQLRKIIRKSMHIFYDRSQLRDLHQKSA